MGRMRQTGNQAGERERKSLFSAAAMKAGAAFCVLSLGAAAILTDVHAQSARPAPADQTLLLSSEELLYNFDSQRVIASGAVRIDYDGYQMVADRVEYDQRSKRLYAIGNIELIEPDGNRIYADELDITDDFRDGFVNALRIETPDNTRLVADSATRSSGNETTLNNGVYTACEVCANDPDAAPLWQIKARRVIQNGEKRTIRLEGASFELFGRPIAYLPYLVVPDYQNRRQSGFLTPTVGYSSELGARLSVPYYYVLSPSMDMTFTGTGYTKQGFLAEAEFRKRFANGDLEVRVAGISQLSREEFDRRTVDFAEEERGLVQTTGAFNINSRWKYGWDLTLQSDQNFGETYNLDYFNAGTEVSQIYLTGLNDRNYFNVQGYYFDIQDEQLTAREEEEQPVVHPVMDYGYTADQAVLGGELSFDVNATSLTRETTDFDNFADDDRDRLRGAEGFNSRFTGEVEWRRNIHLSGLVLTPIAAARGDVHSNDIDTPAGFAPSSSAEDVETRSMLTAGLEARYPLLVTTASSSHIIEPIGQIFVRPDEPLAGGLPNEDAQSFVFDASSLFERDKFSGYDRIEGGTRANLGFRYTGTFANGVTMQAVAGQSYHIAGENPFAADGFVNAGADSGLETDVSDYVAEVGLRLPSDIGFRAGVRVDEQNIDANRVDIAASYSNDILDVSGGLVYQREQPEYNFAYDRYEVRGSGTLRIRENWSVFGATSFDAREYVFTTAAIGLGYDDECFSFRIAYTEKRDSDLSGSDWSIGAKLSFRTLGDFASGNSAVERW